MILENVLDILQLDKRTNVASYTDVEYSILKKSLVNAHENTLYGACLCKELHTLFHKEYTYYNPTIYDFIDYSERIIAGYYDVFFAENHLFKNININYIKYLKNTVSSENGA